MNTSSAENHRQQKLVQIWLPLIITLVIVLALAILSVIGAVQGSSQIERWGNLSAVWVIIPVLIWGVILLAIVGGLAFGVYKLLGKMPGWMLKAQLFMVTVERKVQQVSDTATKPIIGVNTFTARASALKERYFPNKKTMR